MKNVRKKSAVCITTLFLITVLLSGCGKSSPVVGWWKVTDPKTMNIGSEDERYYNFDNDGNFSIHGVDRSSDSNDVDYIYQAGTYTYEDGVLTTNTKIACGVKQRDSSWRGRKISGDEYAGSFHVKMNGNSMTIVDESTENYLSVETCEEPEIYQSKELLVVLAKLESE